MVKDPAGAATVIMLRALKKYGMAQAAGELMDQGAPAFEAAIPILSQLLKAETSECEVRSVAYQIKAVRYPAYEDLSGLTLHPARSIRSLFASSIAANSLHRRTTSVWWAVPARANPYRDSLGNQAIEYHRKKAWFFDTGDLLNALEQEKMQGKSGQLAD